jgi:hypothetical protein
MIVFIQKTMGSKGWTGNNMPPIHSSNKVIDEKVTGNIERL